jgi:hypothetical protein
MSTAAITVSIRWLLLMTVCHDVTFLPQLRKDNCADDLYRPHTTAPARSTSNLTQLCFHQRPDVIILNCKGSTARNQYTSVKITNFPELHALVSPNHQLPYCARSFRKSMYRYVYPTHWRTLCYNIRTDGHNHAWVYPQSHFPQ